MNEEEEGMKVNDLIERQARVIRDFFRDKGELFDQAVDTILSRLEEGRKILVFGNGGSASQAQHFASELVNRFMKTRQPVPALSLAADSSSLTSIANDGSFEFVFSRQVEALGKAGDVAVALTTSGNSPNILKAVQAARDNGLFVLGLTGMGGGKVGPLCDILLDVPSQETPRVQEAHLFLLHLLSQKIEERLG
jgi:D-sedoheptulose 7-phosphate isomerase